LVPADRGILVEQVGDAAAGDWDSFVAAAPGATAYHRYCWRTLIAQVFGKQSYYLAARQNGAIVGVLPLVRLKSLVFGDFLVSLPYLSYGGLLAATPEAREQLLAAATALARELGVSHMELRHSAVECGGLTARDDKVTMLLELPDTAAALFQQCGSKLRSQVKRPQKEGAVCVSGRDELLPEFYAVFAENMRDLGTPVYPLRFFAGILAMLPQSARVFVVRWKGAPVAAGIVISHGATLEIPWASSLRDANAIGVNMLLYWTILEYACESGHRVFDFGRCTVDSGPHRFKKQWGAVPESFESQILRGHRRVAPPAAGGHQPARPAADRKSALSHVRHSGNRPGS
jgi:serine/alanine adding enzyme